MDQFLLHLGNENITLQLLQIRGSFPGLLRCGQSEGDPAEPSCVTCSLTQGWSWVKQSTIGTVAVSLLPLADTSDRQGLAKLRPPPCGSVFIMAYSTMIYGMIYHTSYILCYTADMTLADHQSPSHVIHHMYIHNIVRIPTDGVYFDLNIEYIAGFLVF